MVPKFNKLIIHPMVPASPTMSLPAVSLPMVLRPVARESKRGWPSDLDPVTMRETRKRLMALDELSCCSHLVCEKVDEVLSVSSLLCKSAFQTK